MVTRGNPARAPLYLVSKLADTGGNVIWLLAFIPALLALFLWAVVDLNRFVTLVIIGAIVYPASLAKPFGTNIDAADLFVLLACVAWLINNSIGRAPDPWVKKNPMLIPGVVFLAVNALSIAWSIKPKATVSFTVQLAELVVIYPLVLGTLPRSLRDLRAAMLLFLGLCCVEAVWALIVYAESPLARSGGTAILAVNKNALGSFLGAGVVIAFVMLRDIRSGPARMWLLLAAVLNAAGLFASDSRGAILGTGVAILVAAFILRHLRVGAVLAGVLALALYVGVLAPSRATFTTQSGAYTSASVRSIAWADGIKYIGHHPWLGTGGRTYFYPIPQLGIGGLLDPDNLFLLTWAELGIAGVVALIFLLYKYLQTLWDVSKLPREAASIGVTAGAIALSLIVHFQFDVSWSRGETTLEFAMIGVMISALRLAGASASEAPPSPEQHDPELQLDASDREAPIPVGSA